MSVLPDHEIRRRASQEDMIQDFIDYHPKVKGEISYGLTSFGYDARLAPEFLVFSNVHNVLVDPKDMDPDAFVKIEGEDCIIPPGGFILGKTVEQFKIPRDVMVLCVGKSTYARCGIIINVTPLEPEWQGYVTLEISNASPLPARVYANEGICQFVFFKNFFAGIDVSYADKAGKYQDQVGITPARVT